MAVDLDVKVATFSRHICLGRGEATNQIKKQTLSKHCIHENNKIFTSVQSIRLVLLVSSRTTAALPGVRRLSYVPYHFFATLCHFELTVARGHSDATGIKQDYFWCKLRNPYQINL